MLVDAGGGLDAQEGLNGLLRRQTGHCSEQFSSLTQDLLGPTQRLRWKGCAHQAQLRWRTLQPSPNASSCDLEQFNNYHQRRFYAATILVSRREQQTYLDCDLESGEIRVWLNSQMVLLARRNCSQYWAGMPFRATVALKAGENQLVVQRDLPEFGGVNFRIRLGVRVSRSRPLALFPSEHHVASCEPWLLQEIPEEWRLFRADYLMRLGLAEEAHHHLSPWSEAYPNSALLAWVAAKWEGARGPKNKHWEQVRQLVPEWAVPQPTDCLRYLDRGRFPLEYGRAEFQRFSFLGSSPDDTYAPLVRAVQPELSSLLARFPGHPWLLFRRLSLMTPFAAPVDVERIPERDLPEAARIMEALAKRYPNGWGWDYQRLAHVHRRLGNQLTANIYYRKAASYRPTDPDAWEESAANEKVPAVAAAAYRKALKMSPDRVYLRDRIEQCEGSAPLLETMAPPQSCLPPWELSKEEIVWGQRAGFYDVCDGRHPARRILLQEMRQVIYSDGGSYGCYRLVAETPPDRVFSPEYPKYMKKLLTTLHTSRLYRGDGRVQDTLDLSQGSWPAFPDCEEGDIAESVWTVSSAGLAGFSQDWDVGPSGRYVLVRPNGRRLQVSRPPDACEVRGRWTVETWTSSGPLKVSTYSDWSELTRGLRRHLLRPIGSAAEAQARMLGSASSAIRWVEERDWGLQSLLTQSEPSLRAMDDRLGCDTSTAVILYGLLRALNVQVDLCFPLRDTSIPGTWFGRPTLEILEQESYWWKSPQPGTPLLSLSRGLITRA